MNVKKELVKVAKDLSAIVKKNLSVFEQHQKNIAIKTLKMNDVFANIMGGKNKQESRDFLKSIGYTDQMIATLEK